MEKINLAKLIKDAAFDHGVDYRNDYSGRGMYGETCVGVTGSSGEIRNVMTHVTQALLDWTYDLGQRHQSDADHVEKDWSIDEAKDAVSNLMQWTMDSMGRGSIMYWPDIKADDDEEEMDDEDEEEDEDEE